MPPSADHPPPPTRREDWAAAVSAAVAYMRGVMADPDSTRGFDAATKVIDLEMARMRHGRQVSGTEEREDESIDLLPLADHTHPLPLEGGGSWRSPRGRGGATAAASVSTPHPNPPPQGGRGQAETRLHPWGGDPAGDDAPAPAP